MPTQATLTLVDAIAEEAFYIGAAAVDDTMRAQAALVRAIVDEIGRYHPSHRRLASLHDQLGEELSRLLAKLGERDDVSGDLARAEPHVDVLLVEDDEPTLHATASAIRALGYACRTASSADEALSEHARLRAAVVVTDWNMPGMTGLDLCRVLKQRDAHVYVILVSGHDAGSLDGVRGGVDDFLSKPIDVDDLAARLGAAQRLVLAFRDLQRVHERLGASSIRPVARA